MEKKQKKIIVDFDWSPNKNSKIPMYQQIIDYISSKISSGDWSIGSFLPTQRELAKKFDVNRSTIIYSLKELESNGII
ncbi:MAG: GntR family transcriptional regulator, partial [Fusobacteriaceae bacterium]|nr:GntR family transcriptional regulator [Fusobacteriaceae bacterium]